MNALLFRTSPSVFSCFLILRVKLALFFVATTKEISLSPNIHLYNLALYFFGNANPNLLYFICLQYTHSESNVLFDLWERMETTATTNNSDNQNGRKQRTKKQITLALNIVTHLFPGHRHVFDWLIKLSTIPLGDVIDRGLWVRVAVTYVVNYGTLEDEMMLLVQCAKINPYNSEVIKILSANVQSWT